MSRPPGVTETKRRSIDPAVARDRARKAGIASQSLDTTVARIERAKDRLTPEHLERLRSLLASAPTGGRSE